MPDHAPDTRSRGEVIDRALARVADRVHGATAARRCRAVLGPDWRDLARGMGSAGRLTVAFHPDRADVRGRTAAAGLHESGRWSTQWESGASSGHRSAVPGGRRAGWEADQFGVDEAVARAHRPVYGALDLLGHRHGGSPAFGSCFLVLADDVRSRTTFAVGDTHLAPTDVGTVAAPEALVAGLAEQAASGSLLGQGLGVGDLRAVLSGDVVSAPKRTLDHYVEAQVHGGVSLRRDVTAIVVDPSFVGSEAHELLAAAAAAADVALDVHPGTVTDAASAGSDPRAVAWVDDHDYLADLCRDFEAVADADGRVTAAAIGRVVRGLVPGAPTVEGDPFRSPWQRVKHLWRLAYLTGRDAVATRHVGT